MRSRNTFVAGVVLLASLGLVAPAQAASPVAVAQAAPAAAVARTVTTVKCINLRTGIQRTLAGQTCPRGWVRAVPLASVAAKRKAYLRDARYLDASLKQASDASLFGVGRAVCRTLDNGGNFQNIIDEMLGADITTGQTSAILTSAVYNLCPGHRAFLDNWLNS